MSDPVQRMHELCFLLNQWDKAYRSGRPLVSDTDFDRHLEELLALEKQLGVVLPDSPSQRVGSDLSNDLAEAPHSIPVLSLDKVYSTAELLAWMNKIQQDVQEPLAFTGEEKLDGVSLVIYYEKGILVRALTRGDGYVGNLVTENARTIRSLPLRLAEPVNLAVRGEVFLPKDCFAEVNKKLEVPYANPRNLAAGTLRRVKSKEVAAIPLEIFIYEGFFDDNESRTHQEVRHRLQALGFPISPNFGVFGEGVEAWVSQISQQRKKLNYDIDGLVFKVDQLGIRERLGYTGHHPRWAMAYKFESPLGESAVLAIDVQVGRTGRITPVARIQPVNLAGATITNATLHNQAYIDALELGLGDRVSVSRRGEVIPAIERVVEKMSPHVWKMPTHCPSCGSELVVEGGHHFCRNPECPEILRQNLAYFTASDTLDIATLGPETLDFVFNHYQLHYPEQLYTFDWDSLFEVKGFGTKKIAAIKESLEKSKSRPFKQQLAALGIPELGTRTIELLMSHGLNSWETLLEWLNEPAPLKLLSINGVGETTINIWKRYLFHPSLQKRVVALREQGFSFREQAPSQPKLTVWADQTWCVTGSFEHFNPRSLAEEEIQKRGGRVVGSVSSKLTHLLVGTGAGSKLNKAIQLGVKTVTEDEFLRLLQQFPVD